MHIEVLTRCYRTTETLWGQTSLPGVSLWSQRAAALPALCLGQKRVGKDEVPAQKEWALFAQGKVSKGSRPCRDMERVWAECGGHLTIWRIIKRERSWNQKFLTFLGSYSLLRKNAHKYIFSYTFRSKKSPDAFPCTCVDAKMSWFILIP